MIEYITYLSAQRVVGGRARNALPDAPVTADPIVRRRLTPRLRLAISQTLRALADRIEPAACPGRVVCDIAHPA